MKYSKSRIVKRLYAFIATTMLIMVCYIVFGDYVQVKAEEEGTDADLYENEEYVSIYTADDLEKIRSNPYGKYRLMADIDLNEDADNSWTAISRFYGELDGNGKTISGLYLKNDNFNLIQVSNIPGQNGLIDDGAALFGGLMEGSVIKDLSLSGTQRGTSPYIAILAYINEGTIQNVSVTADIVIDKNEEKRNWGSSGIIVAVNAGIMEDCNSYGSVSNDLAYILGGICGENRGTLIDCNNYADISQNNTYEEWEYNMSYIGGIAGTAIYDSYIKGCTNNGSITLTQNAECVSGSVGGIVGSTLGCSDANLIYMCTNNGNLYSNVPIGTSGLGEVSLGGIVGEIYARSYGFSMSAGIEDSLVYDGFLAGNNFIVGCVNNASGILSGATEKINLFGCISTLTDEGKYPLVYLFSNHNNSQGTVNTYSRYEGIAYTVSIPEENSLIISNCYNDNILVEYDDDYFINNELAQIKLEALSMNELESFSLDSCITKYYASNSSFVKKTGDYTIQATVGTPKREIILGYSENNDVYIYECSISHLWDSGVVTTEATYASDGERTYTCTGCMKTKKEIIPKLDFPENGWYYENGNAYWYENGVRQGYNLNNPSYRGKEIYDPETNAWYWLDNDAQGAVAKSKDVYQESDAGIFADREDGTGKWVRYDEDGHMVKGWSEKDGNRYYFDPTYGTMYKGYAVINGVEYYFNVDSGILEKTLGSVPENGWKSIDGKLYWYENYARQGYSIENSYRGKEIYDSSSDAWYWLDNVQDGAVAKSKDVYQESLAGEWGDTTNEAGEKIGKWVRYDENGHMIKGWSEKDGNRYYFDPTYGTMAKGKAVIDGQTYYFDVNTGVLQQ